MKRTGGKDETSSILMQTPGNILSTVCSPNEISLYVHFPFCKRICPYCHFYVIRAPLDTEGWQEAFINELLLDWDLHQPALKGRLLRSVYFGGGTPSLFKSIHFKRLLDAFYNSLIPCDSIEVTLEANPEAISQENLNHFFESGINRISLGVQSLEDNELIRLGRGHRSSKALEAIELIQKSKFERYSLDLMMETPGQTRLSWQRTLERIIEINPPHLSLYNLVIEPSTPYAKQEKHLRKQMVDAQTATEMLEDACKAFSKAGLERYEISAFARKGHESIHNTGYWRGREFIGIGPSAFSFFDGKRPQKHCDRELWAKEVQKGSFAWGMIDEPEPEVRQAELLAVHLRLSCGVDIESFQSRWGTFTQGLEKSIESLVSIGWLEKDNTLLKMSLQGRLFYDRLASELMPV